MTQARIDTRWGAAVRTQTPETCFRFAFTVTEFSGLVFTLRVLPNASGANRAAAVITEITVQADEARQKQLEHILAKETHTVEDQPTQCSTCVARAYA